MGYIPKITIMMDSCQTCGKSINIPTYVGGCGCASPVIFRDRSPNSPCVQCPDVCDDVWFTDCVLYAGAKIPALGIENTEKLTETIIKLAAEIIKLKSDLAALTTRVNALD